MMLARRQMRLPEIETSRGMPVVFLRLDRLESLSAGDLLTATPGVRSPLFHCDSQFTFVQGTVADKQDFADLGSYCADVCKILDRGLNRRHSEELSRSLLEAIEEFTT